MAPFRDESSEYMRSHRSESNEDTAHPEKQVAIDCLASCHEVNAGFRRESERAGISPAEPEVRPRSRLSLLWWVFLANGAVLVVAFLLLALTPITISSPITVGQLALLLAGLAAMLVLEPRPAATRVVAFFQADRADELDRPRQARSAAIGYRSAQCGGRGSRGRLQRHARTGWRARVGRRRARRWRPRKPRGSGSPGSFTMRSGRR